VVLVGVKDLCLIIPPSPFLLDERVFPFLGILKVASSALESGTQVEVLDLSGIKNYLSVVSRFLTLRTPKAYGITCTTAQYPYAADISKLIRTVTTVPVIVGGPHPTVTHAAIKGGHERAQIAMQSLLDEFDFVVAGDGELAIREIMDYEILEQREVARVIDADEPKGDLFMQKSQIDDYPLPERRLIDLASYRYTIDGKKATSLISQLGCPFNCQFCCGRSSAMLRRTRIRSTDSVLSEIEHLYREYGYTGFMFYDDELNVNKNMAELMEKLHEFQVKENQYFALRGFLKSELFTEQQADIMRKAGFSWVLIGFESGADRILYNINKRATREDNTRAVEIAKKYGLKVKALMSVGHPGEDWDTIQETRQWLLDVQPEDFDVSVITPYPGSPYYDNAEHVYEDIWKYTCSKSGDELYSLDVDYSSMPNYYKGDPDDGYQSYVYTDKLCTQEVALARNMVEEDVREELGLPYPTKGERTWEEMSGSILDNPKIYNKQPSPPASESGCQ
jgi:radical SAM superfamily enzyme YgiQ (UPF0313 family)